MTQQIKIEPLEPAQGIQAGLEKLFLFNPDALNKIVGDMNDALGDAEQSATDAANSANAAAKSATAAAASESAVEQSATAAENAADAAKDSENAAKTSENNAAASATDAASSKAAAAKSAAAAAESAETTQQNEEILQQYVDNAGRYAANAAASSQDAAGFANDAEQYAEEAKQATAGKADKATTLAGYGITDAYTKTQVDQKINDVQGDVDTLNTKVPSNASASNKMATAAEISNLQNQIDENALEIKGLQGAGGALTATNLGSNPTQQSITEYAIDQIWPNNTNFTWNASNPAASTFTDANGIARTAAEIFNSTWVNNTYDDHRWQLTNTQNTAPTVFEWADVGRDIVSVATATTAGIVRVGDGSQMVVNASTGDISLDGSKAESIRGTIGAVATNQGTANAGKVLGVGSDGNVAPVDGASGTGRNIGDIFWTTRTDSALNGAVEANGAQYNFADVNGGDNNVQALLESGALPSVSIAKFDEMVAEQDGCDSFGYGTDTKWTSWELLLGYAYTNKASTEAEVGDPVYDAPGGNIIGHITFINDSDRTFIEYDKPDGTSDGGYAYGTVDGPVESTTYFKVPKKLGRVLVRSQKPTEDNNYTWYNVYSDGWVEQGGGFPIASSATYQSITFPIEFSNTKYFIQKNPATDSTDTISWRTTGFYDLTTTSANTYNSRASQGLATWYASGYAAASEYTPDKWDYQNIQVLRPMVQLFNGATDEAVAQCTEVLADVAGLKQATDGMIDYVVESQEPTSGNGFTWYRLYKSGWVEQGGRGFCSGSAIAASVSLPIVMKNSNYAYLIGIEIAENNNTVKSVWPTNTNTTTLRINGTYGDGGKNYYGAFTINWFVSGMSAQGA